MYSLISDHAIVIKGAEKVYRVIVREREAHLKETHKELSDEEIIYDLFILESTIFIKT